MNKKTYASLTVLLALFTTHFVAAQIIVTTGQNATQLAQRLTGDGVTVTNAQLTCPSGGSGRFVSLSSSLAIDSGIVLTTGYASSGGGFIGVNSSAGLQASADRFALGDLTLSGAIGGQITQDACVLEFDFTPQGDTVKFQYKFGSEEYPEYACSGFNDAFGFFISGPGITGQQNIALVPNTTIPVTINTVNPGAGSQGTLSTCTQIGAGVPFTQYYINNSTSTTLTYDGTTTLLTARRPVIPCTTYHLKLAIADVGDGTFDSGVFLKAGSLTSEAAGVTPMAMATTLTQPYLVRGCLDGAFNVSRPNAQPTPLTVRYHIVGTATNGVDYTLIPDSVVITANATTAQRTITPLIVGAPTGPRTVKIKILAPGCQSTTVYVDSAQLTIYDSLQAKILTPDTLLCPGASLPISVAGDAGLSYSWVPSAGLSSATVQSPVANPATTTTYVLNATLTNFSCPAVTDTVTIRRLPAMTISGPQTVCEGTAYTWSAPSSPDITGYVWTTPAGWTGTSTTSSITATPGALSGNVTVAPVSVCGAVAAGSLVVTITPLPTVTSITGSTTPCVGSAQTYAASGSANGTTYTWTLPGTGWSGTSNTASISTSVGAAAGSISVTSSNSCGTSTAATLAVTPVDLPTNVGPITGPLSPCAAAGGTYSIPAVPGATSYAWLLPAGWSGSSTSTSILATAGSSGGNIAVIASNFCGSDTATLPVSITLPPATPGAISGQATVCAGGTQTYSVTPVAGATSYTWTLPTGWTGSSGSNSITVNTTATSGTVTVTASNACGTSTASTLAVTSSGAAPQPGPITGVTAVCSGVAQTYSITPVGGATSYTWTLPGGWTGTSSTSSITAIPSGTGGTITVVANASCGASSQQTLTVTAADIPATPGSISGAATVCIGAAQTYSIATIPGATSYVWTLPVGWSGTSSASSITATAGATGGTISVAASNYCGTSATQTLAVNSAGAPAAPGIITGAAAVCSGTSQTYSITPVAGAVSYTWTLPNGWTGTSSGASITVIPSATGGMVSVAAVSSCGISISSTLSVSASATPAQPGIIAGPAAPCIGSSQTYSVAAVSGASSYAWTVPGAGWTGTSTTASLLTQVGTAVGNITVTATNNCGTSTAATLAVAPISIPAQPGAITGTATPCVGAANVYSIAAVSGATSYVWTLPAGWSGASSSTSISAIPTTASGTLTVAASNGCGTSAAQSLSATPMTVPAQPGTISVPPSLCQAASGVYSVASVAGASSYTWTLPAGWSGGSNSNSVTITAGTSGTISVTANNVCGASVPNTAFVLVAPMPTLSGGISGAANLCIGSGMVYTAPAATNAVSYVWTLPSWMSGSSTTSNISVSAAAAGSGTISVSAVNGCGTSAPVSMPVTVNPPTATAVYVTSSLPNGAVCPGVPATFTATSTGAGATPSYTWTRNGSIQTGATGSTFTIPNPQHGEVIGVQMASSSACPLPAVAVSAPLTISVLPAVVPGININTQYSNVPTICSTTQLNFSANIVGGGTAPVYQWRKNGAVVGTNSPAYSASGWSNGDTVWAILTSNAQCATPASQPSNKIGVIVGTPITPVVSIAAMPGTTYVPGQPVTFTATATGGGASPTFQWMRNSQAIIGAYGPTYITSALTGGDTISARLTSSDLCATTAVVFSNKLVMSGGTAEVASVSSSAGIGLYPNPNGGVFTLSISGGRSGERVGIEVLNALGQRVWTRELETPRAEWNLPVELTDVANGVYLLRLRGESGTTATTRFEVQK